VNQAGFNFGRTYKGPSRFALESKGGEMMTKASAFLTLLLAVSICGGCASARRTGAATKDATVAAGQEVGDKTEDVAEKVGETTSDATITAAVKMKFASDKAVDALNINVDTKDGHVTLTGTVNTKAEADRAVALARTVEGVKGVTPRLTIRSA
jgi:hyperosmotically inducible protein